LFKIWHQDQLQANNQFMYCSWDNLMLRMATFS